MSKSAPKDQPTTSRVRQATVFVLSLAAFFILWGVGSPGLFAQEIEVKNWAAPPYWTHPEALNRESGAREALAAGRQPLAAGPVALPFISLFPCRLVDTRAPAYPAPLGGGYLPAATVRSYTLTGVCNIPANAQAVSLNATVVKPAGPGFLTLYPQGGAFPPVSTLNYLGGDVIVNAAVVPLSSSGGISMALGVSGGDVVLDTNGYYAPVAGVSSLNTLSGDVTLAAGTNVTLTPSGNTLTIASAGGGGGGGTVTSVGTGAGLTGGPITSAGTVSVASGGITSSMIAAGAVGLAQINSSQVQARVASTCPAGSNIQTINADGSVVCTGTSPLAGQILSTLDSTGDVGKYNSITIGSDGLGLISYHDQSNGYVLKVAHCSNAACTSATVSVLDSGGNLGSYTSITIGSDGLGLISYRDFANAYLKVAHCSNVACTSATLSTLDTSVSVGLYTSVTIGSDGLGLISYHEYAPSFYGRLKVAHCSNITCTSATLSTLDSTAIVGLSTSVTIGSDGLGLISYFDQTNGQLKVAHCSNATCTSAALSFLGPSTGGYAPTEAYTSITIGSDGLGLISFAGPALSFGVAHCSNVVCSSATLSVLDVISLPFYNSITIGADGLGLISYGAGPLKVAHCLNVVCSSATLSTLDSTTSAFNSITVGTDGFGLISYYDQTNHDLKVAHCSNVPCSPYVRRR